MTSDGRIVIEMLGEGKADVGAVASAPEPPQRGIVPILVHKLCSKPERMFVTRNRVFFLHGKSLWQKVMFAKRQAALSTTLDGVVVVVDSEGGPKESEQKMAELQKGRNFERPDFPMVIGVAQSCIETWLLADAPAIRRAMELTTTPEVPEKPEDLPSPHQDRNRNPKTELAKAAGTTKKELSAKEKDRIATAINDLGALRTRCLMGFAPFADEVDQRIRPLF